ncbi:MULTISPECIES: hypothetical protein [Helicobacter]|uniref:hypothetical protein n=1 Tax=Helicobacter TaxID=209 RepID=UPI00262255C6|nr:hypothetical protein [Helicobacter sp. UBA3407]
MDNENLGLNENQMGDSAQGENDESQGTSENQEQGNPQDNTQEIPQPQDQTGQNPDNPQNNTQNQGEDSAQNNDTQDTQTPQEQTTIQQQIQNLKKVLESLESQNEQEFNQALEISKLQDVLLQIEQIRQEVFANAQEKLEESEAYFSLVGVKVALLEKLKAQNEC